MSRHSAVSDLDPACQNHKSAWCDFARRDDAIARRIGFELTEPPQPTHLRRLQRGEHLIASGFDQRASRLRHDFHSGPRKAQVLGLRKRSGRETDSPLEESGFEPSVPLLVAGGRWIRTSGPASEVCSGEDVTCSGGGGPIAYPRC